MGKGERLRSEPTLSRPPLEPAEEVPPFSEIFRVHAPYALRLLARLGVPRADVPDACQDVFLTVHRRLLDFDPARGSLRNWIYGICVRTAAGRRRQRRARNERCEEFIPEPSVPALQHQELERRSARERLEQVLSDLDEAKRAVFVLYELEALPMKEIATILGCPVQTAYSRLHAARAAVFTAFGLPLKEAP